MKVLAVNWRDIKNPEAGGAEVHLHEILSRLAGWGHEATQLSAAWPGCEKEETIDGIRVIRHGRWYDANFSLPLFARRLLRHRTYDVVLEDINKLPFFMPLVTSIPVVPVIPHLFGATAFREANAAVASYVVAMEKLIPAIFRKNRFMVISPSTKEDLIARGVDSNRIDVVLCGLDHDRYRNLGLERFAEPTIVHLGRLRRYKSVEVAIGAMSKIRERFPAARLAIIGDGPHKRALEAHARRLGLSESVRFLGFLRGDELVEYLNRAHLLVNPSPKEGWGLTVVEANACGLPVVASDRPGLRDSVREGETGFLVPYGDEAAFAARALSILENGELWRRLSAGALERVKELTWERCARETLSMLEGVVGK
ncbi:MAG: glycosyltransferase family 4 protein [Candidatus Krumholzibacteria bacterium]|nr:glycosyltransferase family 4 protein [Candidatus Krumholzibacteria bacterium]